MTDERPPARPTTADAFLAALTIVFALYLLGTYAMVRRAPGDARPADDVALLARRVAGIAREHPASLVPSAVGGFFLLTIAANLWLQARLARRFLAKKKDEPLVPEDPTRAHPPWGLAAFALVFLAHVLLQLVASSLAPPARLVLETGSPVHLGARPFVVPGTTGERARVVPEPDGGWGYRIVVSEGERSPPVLVNGAEVGPGPHPLEPGARLEAGGVKARLETPTNAERLLLACATSVLTIALVIAVARVQGGTLRDLGLSTDGLLSELGRGALASLAAWPVILVGMVIWSALLQALGVPAVGHPLLKLLETDRSPATLGALVLLAVVLAPVAEELLFRGLYLRALRRVLPSRTVAVLVSSAFFAAIHPGLWNFLPILVIGTAFGTLFTTSPRGSLVGAIAAHVLFNGANVALEEAIHRAL